jgi:type I restriction enzyme M protein
MRGGNAEFHRSYSATPCTDAPEDPDEYRAENVFWVPPEARWSQLQSSAKQLIDDAVARAQQYKQTLQDLLNTR